MSFRIKNYMPRSLFGRAALILIVPVITIQLVVSVVFIQRHFDGVTRQLSRGVMLETRALLAAVDGAASLGQAQSQVTALAGNLSLAVTLPAQALPQARGDLLSFWDLSGRSVGAVLHEGLATLALVDLVSSTRSVDLWLTTRHGPMLVKVPRPRVTPSNPHQLLVITAFASLVMTAVAFVFLRNQLSPITRLASAAVAFGRGEVTPYKPRGAIEVRAAGHAFLDMRSRIERQTQQRTLMLSGVSHDLRGPLTRMKLGLSLLPQGEDTKALLRDVQDMERLVDEFLAFARGDAMEEPKDCDPAQILAEVLERAHRLGQKVTLGPCSGLGLVRLRPQAMGRALDNLVGNAVRYGSRAEVSFALTEKSLRFSVQDDGPGIPPDKRDEALLPFARLDAARDPNNGGGVGLGLSIAADIARSHGGVLRLGDSASLGGLRADLVLAR